MAKYPAMPLWTDAYLSDTPPVSAATWEHHGVYLLLLMKAWRTPGQRLPNDPNWLALHMGCTVEDVEQRIRPVLETYFKCDGKFWKQKRLSHEHDYLKKQSRAQSQRAKSREKKKKQQHPNANPVAPESESGGAPTPTPTPTPSLSNEREKESIERFDEFWKAYPSRGEHQNPKKPARQKFEAAVRRGIDPAIIVAGARAYAQRCRRNSTDPKFVAQAVTWLNQERWNDQPGLDLDRPASVAERLGVTPLGVGG